MPGLPLLHPTCAHTHTCSRPHQVCTPGALEHPPGGARTASEFQRVCTPNLLPARLLLHFEASWALRREREALSSLFLQDPHCPRPRRLSLGVFWLSDVCLLGGEALFFRQESGALFRSRFIFPALKFQFCLDRLPMHELGQAINIQALFADTGFSSIFQKRTKAHY